MIVTRWRAQLFLAAALAVTLAGLNPALADADKPAAPTTGIQRPLRLVPGKGNPRNSEGSFVTLKDGRILFVYTHFIGGSGDDASAYLAARSSADQGAAWTDTDMVVVPNEGTRNVMSVSLLRLQSGEIALFYLRKNSTTDCRPFLRISVDEAKTWSEPHLCVPDEGYYVLNNDRAVQLRSGRLVLPLALHTPPGEKRFDPVAAQLCYLSDDNGKTWRRSKSQLTATRPDGKKVVTQEPGVVELKGGRLLLFCRTNAGSQYVSQSPDGGDTWEPLTASNIISPLSPASIKRIPKTGDLFLAWNNHDKVDAAHQGKRTPFHVAVSRDEGKTWEKVKAIEDDPDGWYCYTAIAFAGDHVLLGHCAGNRAKGTSLGVTQITRFGLDWLYE